MERQDGREASGLFTSNTSKMLRRLRKPCAIRKLTDGGSESTTLLQRGLTHQHREFTWEGPHTPVEAAGTVVIVVVEVTEVMMVVVVMAVIVAGHRQGDLLHLTTELDVQDEIIVQGRGLTPHVFKIITLQDFLG